AAGGGLVVAQGCGCATAGRDRGGPLARLRRAVKLLLLGGNGQVGRELRRSLLPLGQLVVATRDGVAADVAADFDEPAALAEVVREVGADVVVNAAAYTAVDKAETDLAAAFRANADAPAAIA